MTADAPEAERHPGHAAIRSNGTELCRYIMNGLVATVVNWAVMRFCLDVLNVPWAWLAFWVGAIFGITVSFLGNRYFVFRSSDALLMLQAAKFLAVYAGIALVVSFVMAIWSDWLRLNTNIGFLVASCVQVALSYVGNKVVVFS